jgi:hypothetical protein
VSTQLSFVITVPSGLCDSFQYPAGSLDFDGPPDGSPPGQTDWRTQAGYCEVGRIGLKHPGIGCKGRCVIINGNFNANAVAGIAPTNSGVAWVGFLQSLSHGSSKRGFATLNLNTASKSWPQLRGSIRFRRLRDRQ